jgi:hypothetical protein
MIDNFVEQVFVVVLEFVVFKLAIFELVDWRFFVNKTTLNIWHTWLKHLKKQNVRWLTKMFKNINLIKFIINKNFCVLCIIIKQEIEFYNNFVIFDKHFLNLTWSDFVEFSILNDKIRYFITFLIDFIKRSVIYVLRVKWNTFKAFKHFQRYNEHENNRVQRLRIEWRKEYSNNKFDDYRFEYDI